MVFEESTDRGIMTGSQVKIWEILLKVKTTLNAKNSMMSFIPYHTPTAITHFRLNRLSHTIDWKSPMSILGTSGYEIYILLEKNG